MSLPGAINQLQAKALSVSGVRAAPPKLTESQSVFPFVVVYPRTGRLEMQSSGFGISFHTIFLELHINRQILPQAVEQGIQMIEPLFKSLLDDPNLNGQITTLIETRYTFGRLEWAGEQTIGYRLELDVKILTSV